MRERRNGFGGGTMGWIGVLLLLDSSSSGGGGEDVGRLEKYF